MKNYEGLNKPNKHFKLSSTTKYILSTITDDAARAAFRQNMIQAQLQSEMKPVKEDKKK
jgi:hypothetical protein